MELKKILYYKKILFGIIGLIIINMFLFTYFNKYEKRYEPDDSSYSQEYEQYIDNIIKTAKKMGMVSVFSKNNSFAKNNVEKTGRDYEKFDNLKITGFNNAYIKAFFEYKGTGIVLFIISVLLVILYKQDSQEVRLLIFSTPGGRGKLQIKKTLSILLMNFIFVVMAYGTILALSSVLYGGNLLKDMALSIQSVSIFKACTMKISIGMFILVFLLCKTLITFVISLIMWLIYAVTRKESITLGIIMGLAVLQYVFCISDNNNPVFNILKYCNLYYLFYGNGFFTEYKNINIANHAINKNTLSLLYVLIVGIVCGAAGICYGTFAKGRKKGRNRSTGIRSFVQRHFPEGYKLLICEKAVLIIIAVAYVSISQTDFKEITFSSGEKMYFEFIDKYEGPPDEASDKEIERIRNELEEADRKFKSMEEAYNRGEIDKDQYLEVSIWYRTFAEERHLLSQIEEQTDYLNSLEVKGWYVNQYKYNKLFNKDRVFSNLIIFISTVLVCSSVFFYERKNKTNFIIRASKDGRSRFFNKKMTSAIVLAALIGIFEIALEIIANHKIYGSINLAAPVQSLELFGFIKWKCSIFWFLAFCYALRLMLIISVAIIASSISILVEPFIAAIGTFTLCVPTFLYMLGISRMKNYSLIDFMQVSTKIILLKSVTAVLVFCVVIFGLSMVLYKIGKKKWCD